MVSDRDNGEGENRAPKRALLRPLALATQLGLTMGLMAVITSVGGLFLGSWLDRRFGTRPLATLLFILIGVLVGLLGMINLALSTARELNAASAQHVQVRTAYSARTFSWVVSLLLKLILVTVVPVGLGLGLGLWLDQVSGSKPLFTVLLSAVAAAGALFALFVIARRAARSVGDNS